MTGELRYELNYGDLLNFIALKKRTINDELTSITIIPSEVLL